MQQASPVLALNDGYHQRLMFALKPALCQPSNDSHCMPACPPSTEVTFAPAAADTPTRTVPCQLNVVSCCRTAATLHRWRPQHLYSGRKLQPSAVAPAEEAEMAAQRAARFLLVQMLQRRWVGEMRSFPRSCTTWRVNDCQCCSASGWSRGAAAGVARRMLQRGRAF